MEGGKRSFGVWEGSRLRARAQPVGALRPCIRYLSRSELYWGIPQDARELEIGGRGDFIREFSLGKRNWKQIFEGVLGYEAHGLWSFHEKRTMWSTSNLFFFFLQNYFFSLSFPFHLLSINVVCTVKNVVFSDLSSWVGNTWDLEIIIVREMVPLTAAFLLAFQFHSWPRWKVIF